MSKGLDECVHTIFFPLLAIVPNKNGGSADAVILESRFLAGEAGYQGSQFLEATTLPVIRDLMGLRWL